MGGKRETKPILNIWIYCDNDPTLTVSPQHSIHTAPTKAFLFPTWKKKNT